MNNEIIFDIYNMIFGNETDKRKFYLYKDPIVFEDVDLDNKKIVNTLLVHG